MIFLILIMYFFFPILTTPILLYMIFIKQQYYKTCTFLFSLNLGLLGYYIIPGEDLDLYRHFQKLRVYEYLAFDKALTHNGTNPLIIENIWFYLVAKTGEYNFLPVMAITITYYFALVILVDYGIGNNLKKGYMILSAAFLLMWYQLILPMSGVRFSTALSISAFALYLIYVKNLKKGYFILLFTSLIHIGMSLVFLLVIINKLIRINYKFLLFILIFISIFFDTAVSLLSNIDISYVNIIILKLKAYINYSANENTINKIITLFKQFICILMIFIVFRYRKNLLNSYFNELNKFLVLLVLFFFTFYYIPSFLGRYSYFVLIFLPVIFYNIYILLNKNLKVIFYLISSVFIILGFYVQYVQLSLLTFDFTMEKYFLFSFIELLLR